MLLNDWPHPLPSQIGEQFFVANKPWFTTLHESFLMSFLLPAENSHRPETRPRTFQPVPRDTLAHRTILPNHYRLTTAPRTFFVLLTRINERISTILASN